MIPRLPSNCEGVDKLLAGGIEQGTVSLVYGEAGTGKTSLALQLSRESIKAYPDHVGLAPSLLAASRLADLSL